MRAFLAAAALAGLAACDGPHTSDTVARMLPDGTWIDLPSLPEGRAQHTTTMLPDGRIIVTGGVLESTWRTGVSSVLVYDPGDDAWEDGGSLLRAHIGHRAFLVDDDHLLLVGFYPAANELFEISSGTSQPIDNDIGADAVVAVLADGSVLAIGARIDHYGTGVTEDATVRRLDPGSLTWRDLAPLAEPIDFFATLTALPDGSAVRLLAGGSTRFDPVSETFVDGLAQDNYEIWIHKVAPLADGNILSMGIAGLASEYILQRYDPATQLRTDVDTSQLTHDHVPPSWPEYHVGYYTVPLADGTVAFVRGTDLDPDQYLGEVRVHRLDTVTGEVAVFAGDVLLRAGQGVVAHPDGGLILVGGLAETNNLDDDGD
jgi:hypothetical protein